MEKSPQSKRQTGNGSNHADIWSAQCADCYKWRTIPTEEEYEEIRSKLIEEPFVCSRKPGVSCDHPADIEYGNSQIWVIDKPNIPKTPSGFKRTTVMRKDYSKMDCYYIAPDGKRLRAITEVAKFLDKNPEHKRNLSTSEFSFASPKIMEDCLPSGVGKKPHQNSMEKAAEEKTEEGRSKTNKRKEKAENQAKEASVFLCKTKFKPAKIKQQNSMEKAAEEKTEEGRSKTNKRKEKSESQDLITAMYDTCRDLARIPQANPSKR